MRGFYQIVDDYGRAVPLEELLPNWLTINARIYFFYPASKYVEHYYVD